MGLLNKVFDIWSDINPKNLEIFIKYLEWFGYLKSGEWDLTDLIRAILQLQKQAGVNPDGEVGDKTLGIMNMPRCAMKERQVSGKWGLKTLKYYIQSRDNSDMTADQWDEEMRLGCEAWSEVTDLKFVRTNSFSDANLVLTAGWIDGPSSTLAYYQLPPGNNYRGRLSGKFDTGERWILLNNSGSGIRLRNVVSHEIGHGLGLYHSNVSSALMAPFYSRNIVKPQQNDDVTRIQRLYGKPTGPTDPPTPGSFPIDLMNTPHEEALVEVVLDKPTNVEDDCVVTLDVYDGEIPEEGMVSFNGNMEFDLFSGVDFDTGNNNWTEYSLTVPSNHFVNGKNKVIFKHTRTFGYKVRGMKVDFVEKDGPGPGPDPSETVEIKVTGRIDDVVIPGYTVVKNT